MELNSRETCNHHAILIHVNDSLRGDCAGCDTPMRREDFVSPWVVDVPDLGVPNPVPTPRHADAQPIDPDTADTQETE